MEIVVGVLDTLRRVLSRAGPYLAIEILLPGGTLVALLMYLPRRRSGRGDVEIGAARSTTG